ncbi:MAG: hypothetical protein J6O73_16140 [Lachnospiraceae bacterium]|nr:hypothetical protein [Lachnospiraceae bacterium]
MERLLLNSYDRDGNVTKTVEARMFDIEFGTIRALMKVLDIDNIEDTGELLRTVTEAWEEILVILGACFPDMAEEDWKHVKVRELLPVIMDIVKFTFTEILTIPVSEKN